jgi:hypothetical protein
MIKTLLFAPTTTRRFAVSKSAAQPERDRAPGENEVGTHHQLHEIHIKPKPDGSGYTLDKEDFSVEVSPGDGVRWYAPADSAVMVYFGGLALFGTLSIDLIPSQSTTLTVPENADSGKFPYTIHTYADSSVVTNDDGGDPQIVIV